MNDTRRVPTIVIGAGKAGLAMSRLLTLPEEITSYWIDARD